MAVLTPELRAWLVPGLAGVIATRDAEGRPEIRHDATTSARLAVQQHVEPVRIATGVDGEVHARPMSGGYAAAAGGGHP